MSSLIIAGDTSGTVTLQAPSIAGSAVLTLPATSGTVVNTAPGTSGNVLTSDGTAWTSSAAAPILTKQYLITDSTDIVVNVALGTSQKTIGSTFVANIPAAGYIKLSSLSARFLNSGSGEAHYYGLGIRINSTNYWFLQPNVNGTFATNSADIFTVVSGTNPSQYYEYYGQSSINAGNGVVNFGTLDVSNRGIPSGLQTIQLITANVPAFTATGTIKGTAKQTRITLEIIG